MKPYAPYIPPTLHLPAPLHLDRLWGVVAIALTIHYAFGV